MERKYVMTKIGAGDYLLPSNDEGTLWRLRTYEDGRVNGLERGPWCAEYWELRRWTGGGPLDGNVRMVASLVDDDFEPWEWVAGSFRKRSEAIEEAMRLGERAAA